MRIFVGKTEITDLVVVDSYKMDSSQIYESFTDGNRVEHRIPIAEKIEGNFDVVLSRKNACDLAQFIDIWNEAVTNGYVLLTVYVTNKGKMETINAYYEMASKQHELTADGTYLDVIEIKVGER